MTQRHDPPNPIQMQKYLGGLEYPAGKQAIVDKARQAGADADILNALESLPDRAYDSPVEVSRAVGKL